MSENKSSIYIRDKSMQTRITFTHLTLYLMMLFPITTLLQIYIDVINKAVFAATFIALFIAILYKANRPTLITGIIVVGLYFWATAHTRFPLYNLNDFFYYAFWIMLVFFLSNKKEIFDDFIISNEKFIFSIIFIWCALIAFAMVLPSSYPYNRMYFKPFGINGFRTAPPALFILSLILLALVYYKKKKYILYSLFPMYVLFMGLSRTYFIVGVFLFAIIWYVYCDKPDKFFITAVPIGIVGIAVYSFSGISDKVDMTINWTEGMYYDYWAHLTSGRSIFWKADMEAYMSSSFLRKLFGNGFNFVYNVNYKAVKSYIWAHNDFIQVLTTFGLAGLVLYLYNYFHLCKNILYRNKAKVPLTLFLLFFFIWLVNAFFNMFYTYSCSCFSYPFIAFAINRYLTSKSEGASFFDDDASADGNGKKNKKSKYIR